MIISLDGRQSVLPSPSQGIIPLYFQTWYIVSGFTRSFHFSFPKEVNTLLYYFAPLEGITNALYRNAHRALFPSLDKYFTPFFIPSASKGLSSKDRRALLSEQETGIPLVPQLLTNRSADFLLSAQQLADLGFAELNLNLGCPSGTVFSKKRGAGLLTAPAELRRFLDEVFCHTPLPISIKTRIGVSDPAEWETLMELYNAYPLAELIIHPRLREEFYHGKPHHDIFAAALAESRAPLVYSGDLFSPSRIEDFAASYPTTKALMLGRGLLANPALAAVACRGKTLDTEQLSAFHQLLYLGYQDVLFGTKPLLHKMKELWHYMICLFASNEKHAKRLRKAQTTTDYEAAVTAIFRDLPLLSEGAYQPPHKD